MCPFRKTGAMMKIKMMMKMKIKMMKMMMMIIIIIQPEFKKPTLSQVIASHVNNLTKKKLRPYFNQPVGVSNTMSGLQSSLMFLSI